MTIGILSMVVVKVDNITAASESSVSHPCNHRD